ncbi:MAG: ABC transporter substrate-binding protein [Gammaproteobacteria bacterium]|nr:ABC transporter substrate-binding protein [Gammaproteobacteria bacterium]
MKIISRIGIPLLTALVMLATTTVGHTAEPSDSVTHGIAMHGNPKYSADFKHFDYVNPNASKGGQVVLGAIGGFDSFNGFIVKGETADGLGNIYDSLTIASADEAFTRYGLLAESMEMPEDRSWIIFNLRREARWHDGKPVTADDVIFTFNIQRQHGTPQFRFYYASVTKVEKLDEHRVRFSFKPGENRELPLIVSELTILPKHYWENREFSKTTLEPPLGSGPYRVKEFEPNRFVTYERVPDYWGKDLPVRLGHNNFSLIRYDYYRDQTVQLEAFKSGDIDYRLENSSKNWATSYKVPAVEEGRLIREEIPHNRTTGMQGFVYNTRRAKFKDPRVRQALGYAFDFEWSNKNLFYDQYTRTRSYFDNSELAAVDLPSAAELEILAPYRGRIPPEVFTREYSPPKTDGSRNLRKNLRQAILLLKSAGWDFKEKRLVNTQTGEAMTIEFLLVSPLFERIVLPFSRNLKRLGIKARVRTVDTAQYIKRLETFDFDAIVTTFGQSLSPGNEQRFYWGSAAVDIPGSRNYIGVRDPVIDELIETLIAAPDRKGLITRTRALDRVLQWGHYLTPHWHIPFDRLAYWNKFHRPEITPMRGAQFDTWWIEE